jgi:hypothetical protein
VTYGIEPHGHALTSPPNRLYSAVWVENYAHWLNVSETTSCLSKSQTPYVFDFNAHQNSEIRCCGEMPPLKRNEGIVSEINRLSTYLSLTKEQHFCNICLTMKLNYWF